MAKRNVKNVEAAVETYEQVEEFGQTYEQVNVANETEQAEMIQNEQDEATETTPEMGATLNLTEIEKKWLDFSFEIRAYDELTMENVRAALASVGWSSSYVPREHTVFDYKAAMIEKRRISIKEKLAKGLSPFNPTSNQGKLYDILIRGARYNTLANVFGYKMPGSARSAAKQIANLVGMYLSESVTQKHGLAFKLVPIEVDNNDNEDDMA
jgi:hypothetical protein